MFIIDFEHNLQPLELVEICVIIARQYQDISLSISFLEKISQKVKNEQQPRILCSIALGGLFLEQKKFHSTKALTFYIFFIMFS